MGGEGSSVGAVVEGTAAPACSLACLSSSFPFFLPSPRSFFPLPRRLLSSPGLVSRAAAVADVGGFGC